MHNKLSIIFFPLLLIGVLPYKLLLADNLYVGVASNFIVPMKIIKNEFEKKNNSQVFISSGSSGSLYAQIMNGAPLDIFLSGDQVLPKKLEENSKGIKGTRFTYATGKLQLFTTKKFFFKKKFPNILRSNNIKYVGIGNPLHVPYGFAATEVLKSLNVFEKLSSKLILSKNVNQVFVMSFFGNLDLAFVSKSDVLSKNKKGKVWDIPQKLYSPIKQDGILLINGENNDNAKSFLKFLSTDLIKTKLKDLGYVFD